MQDKLGVRKLLLFLFQDVNFRTLISSPPDCSWVLASLPCLVSKEEEPYLYH